MNSFVFVSSFWIYGSLISLTAEHHMCCGGCWACCHPAVSYSRSPSKNGSNPE